MELLAIYRGIKKCINTNTIPLKGKQKHNPMKRKDFTRQVRMIGNQKLMYLKERS